MPRAGRVAAGGIVYHVLNRGNGRSTIFHSDADAGAFLELLREGTRAIPMRILGYCLMPDHWHQVLWPYHDGDLSRFMHRLQTTHVRRWFQMHGNDAGGHLYMGRFRSFPVEEQDPSHLLTMLRYVEANPVRAGLVTRAEEWRWSSLDARHRAQPDDLLSPCPIERPADWLEVVNRPVPHDELQRVRTCIARGRPYGCPTWTVEIAKRLGLEFTLRPRGRPKKLT
jgi:putative transposase